MKKSEAIVKSLLFTFILVLISLAIYTIIDFKIDYECSKLPYEVFIKEIKCEKYWRYRNG
ncbi:MAG: hypothetical protein MR405_06035 [Mollicutes bacterium]|nr:hypothetical protein [Mollicutes bacterium]